MKSIFYNLLEGPVCFTFKQKKVNFQLYKLKFYSLQTKLAYGWECIREETSGSQSFMEFEPEQKRSHVSQVCRFFVVKTV